MSLVPSNLNTQLTNLYKRKAAEALVKGVGKAARHWTRYVSTGPSRYQAGQSGPTLQQIGAAAGFGRQDSGVQEGSNNQRYSTRSSMRSSSRSYGRSTRRGTSARSNKKSRKYGGKKRGRGKRMKAKSKTVRRRYTGRVSASSETRNVRYKVNKGIIASKGYSLVQEYGGTVVDPYVAIAGHSTHHFNMALRALCGGFVKLALQKANLMLGNFSVGQAQLETGDRFILRYRPESSDVNAAEAIVTATFSAVVDPNIGAAPDTITNVISLLTFNLMSSLSTLESRKPQIQFTSFTFDPNGASDSTKVVINLMGAKIKYYAESGFTMQNITANEITDAETTDVDALPVKGFEYSGSGSGTLTLIQSETGANDRVSFLADRNGYIQGYGAYATGAGLSANAYRTLNEPVAKNVLTHCRKATPIMIGAGGIHVDNLVYYRTCALDVFVQNLWNFQYGGTPALTGAATKIRHPYGKYKLFMLEKVVEFAGLGTQPSVNVTIRYEKNQEMGLMVIPKKQKVSIRENFIQLGIPGVNTSA